MNKEITAQVHMLPTEFSRLCITNGVLSLHSHKYQRNKWDDTRHLYFLSDEEIKEGDWYYVEHSKKIVQYFERPNHILFREGLFKVIASTDPSLGLPAIPFTWIRDVYVRSNGTIMSVQIEMEEHPMNKATFAQNMYQLKLTDNNEVNVVNWHDGKVWNEIWLGEPQPCILGSATRKQWAKENWPKVVHPTKSVDQELEDAANNYYDDEKHNRMGQESKYSRRDFKAGVNWKSEQSANDIIEFAEWTHAWSFDKINKIWSSSNGQEYTSKQLYELWQQTRNK